MTSERTKLIMRLVKIRDKQADQGAANSAIINRPLYEVKNEEKYQLSSEGIVTYYYF